MEPAGLMAASLFSSGAGSVYTIPPGAPFLTRLAETLVAELNAKDDPAALADALIYVPNRRSARELAAALHTAIGKPAFLPPEIRALGDLESDEPPVGTEEAIAGLGPALSPARRIGELAQLVLAYYAGIGETLPPGPALSAARELAGLLDQASLSGKADWSQLADMVDQGDLAVHWQSSVKFLEIVTEFWPKRLAELGAMDPFARRLAVAEALAQHWRAEPPKGAVIIAGSTGATPASRELMHAAAALEKGLIVLPGLDRSLTSEGIKAIRHEASHPQHALAETLTALGISPPDVAIWPGADLPPDAEARAALIHEALAPASKTSDWLERLAEISGDESEAGFTTRALTGLTLIEAEDDSREALFAALLMRETLEQDGQTAALITPDAGLARAVSALLKQWDVHVPPSAGVPLLRTPAGSLAALVMDWAVDPGDPVLLCAVLKHPLTALDAAAARTLEQRFLRGPRRWTDLEDLSAHILRRKAREAGEKYKTYTGDEADTASAFAAKLSTLIQTHAPDLSRDTFLTGHAAAPMVAALVQALAGERVWSGADGAGAARLLEDFAETTRPLLTLAIHSLPSLMETLASGVTVQAGGMAHPRLSIWGPLEARLQSADRIILAGLNESVWPQRPSADSFLPRHFRTALGLQDSEARLGLSAHDFAQFASAPDVVMLSAKRRDDAPAVASRWVWRLETLTKGALKDDAAIAMQPAAGRNPKDWADALEASAPSCPPGHAMPAPKPPLEARPDRLSVTRINTLQRDPYAIYAEQILDLPALDPLNAPLDARPRGTAVHDALERFEDDGEAKTPERLLALLEDSLIEAGEPEESVIGLRAVHRRTIDWYLTEWRAPRSDTVQDHFLEAGGKLELNIAGGPFTLSAKADRIELRKDGSLVIVDFKTGAPPSDAAIRAGLEQQMPLQALIAQTGKFHGVPQKPVSYLEYVSFKSAYAAKLVGGKKVTPDDTAEMTKQAEAGLIKLIEAYRDPRQAYFSAPRAQYLKYRGDYYQLARRAEWAEDDTDV